MSFNSIQFMCFFPVVVLIYFLIPQKVKYIWLLVCSYYFYMSWNAKYAVLIAVSTVITYLSGLLIYKANSVKVKKIVVAVSFITNLAILSFFKYFDFFLENINRITSRFGASVINNPFDVLLPVGISFYTFQALSYTMDVYRDEIKPEKNFLKYALFVSFFPQLVAGPIERSKNLIAQINAEHHFDLQRVQDGLLLMLWGFFMKMVISDRIAVIVDEIFNNYTKYSGFYSIIAILLFSLQLYCDFASYSNIAIGAAKVMGFELMKNFRQPYLGVTVADFWRRWHISLTSWFRDYLYIPLGGNRKGKLRQYINIFIVFSVSGLWHGANWTYVAWGMINGLYQIVGSLLKPFWDKVYDVLKLNRNSISFRVRKSLVVTALVAISMTFFRATSIGQALYMIKSCFDYNPWIFFDGKLYDLGLEQKDFTVMLLGIAVWICADVLNERGIVIRDVIKKQELWFRWSFYLIAIFSVIVFGVYGSNYNPVEFIYFQF